MARRSRARTEDAKTTALRAAGTLHPHPEAVRDDAFAAHDFFDRRDRLQVRYELLRRHRVDGQPVTDVAAAFGVSRQAFYVAARAFGVAGIAGLLPRPRGPQRAHKCTDEILDFVEAWRPEAAAETVADAIARRFRVAIHPRSLARALARRKKKRRARARVPRAGIPRT
jgi:transposase